MKSAARVLTGALVLCMSIAGLLFVGPGSAFAATPSYGYQSVAYTGVANPPTSDKPQSKLWWNAGSWWADMWTSGGWHIFKLDRSTETWVDTGVVNDTRGSTLSDTLWDGTHLYIASHVVTISSDTSPVASQSGQPAKLYRYTYANGTYTLDSGFPSQITNNSSESMTIDRDSTGAIWSTWTQVSGSASAGWTNTVYVNKSATDGTSWATPFIVPVGNAHPTADDISAVVAFGTNKIGVMWSDQSSGSVYFAYHPDSAAGTASWGVVTALQGSGLADDHINLKTLQADTSGRVYAAVKTSLNDTSSDPSLAQLYLLTFNYTNRSFNRAVISTVGDCVSRPQVVLDTQNNQVHVFQTAPSTSVTSCAYSGTAGSIYEKTATMSDTPSFTSGRGTPVIQDGASANINNVTTTKQSVNSTTGLVVMASNDATKRYWFADESLGAAAVAPVAAFSAAPTSGTAPLPVAFTDTSTNAPTSWSWNFGDGTTSTVQNPSHTYTTAGTYSVTETATNSGGTGTSTRTNLITVGSAPAGGITTVASTTAYSAATTTTVSVTKPAGTATGDVVVASITADLNPTMATVPSGWTPIVNGLSVNSSSSSGARIFTYYHVVGSSDPGTYSWTLSAAEKWGAGITAYRGVNTSTPLDSSVVTAVNTSYSGTSLAIPSITTASNKALLIGGVGLDSTSPGLIGKPSGWTEEWQAGGGQIAEQADQIKATAGASGVATWTLTSGRAMSGWRTALKPAS